MVAKRQNRNIYYSCEIASGCYIQEKHHLRRYINHINLRKKQRTGPWQHQDTAPFQWAVLSLPVMQK